MKAGKSVLITAFVLLTAAANARPATLPPLPQLDLSNTFPGVRNQIRKAEAAAHARPNDSEANGKLGMVLDAYEQYSAAEVCYRRAHLLAPAAFPWAYNLAYVQMKLGKYRDAAAAFEAALKIRPDYFPARLNLAECLLSIGQLRESRALFEEIVRKYPDNPEAYYGLGRVESQQGDAESAARTLEKAIELFPQYGGAHYALAMVYRKLGKGSEAQAQFAAYQANVANNPSEVDPLRAAVQHLNQTPLRYLRQGIELEQAGDLQGAIQAHLKAIELDPDFVQAHINLIQLYARAGEYSKAEEEYRIAVRLNPHRADCYYNYGVLMFGLGKYAEAEQAFRQAIAGNPYYAQAHNNLGFLLQQQGHLQEALREFEEAVKYQPDYRLARFHIGQILANQGDYKAAIEQFQKILEPDDAETPTYLYALATAYARAGDVANALNYMRKARADAVAKSQTQLLAGIDHDLKALENYSSRH
jgi:tetratricopeptide (TPR) repeat protein